MTIPILGWTLLHFVWQGALVAGGAALLLVLAGRRSAALRYGVAVIGMLVMLLLPVLTGFWMVRWPASTPATPAQVSKADADTSPFWVANTRSGTTLGTIEPGGSRPVSSILPIPARFEPRLEQAMPWLVRFWLAGVLVLGLRLLGGWRVARRLTRTGTQPAGAGLQATLERLARRLRVSGPVVVLETVAMKVPAVVGWVRPVLLVPVSALTGLTAEQLDALLAHELAHIRRHDYAINLLQSVVETLLFYHPAVWWLSRRIREEREHCCDDVAVEVCGDRRLYAAALWQLERLRGAGLGLAAAASGGSLLRRIQRLARPHRRSGVNGGPRWVAGLVTISLALVVAAGATIAPAVSATRPSGTSQEQEPDRRGKAREEEARKNASWSSSASGSLSRDTVIRYSGDASLPERWEWAARTAQTANLDRYLVGYALSVTPPGSDWIYLDREVPIRIGKSTVIAGSLRFRGGIEALSVPGIPLDELVGPRAARDLVVFFGFTRRGGGAVLDRVRIASYAFPVLLEGRGVLWLGPVDPGPSLQLIQRIFETTSSAKIQEDLVELAGGHPDPAAVVPVLVGWLDLRYDEVVRSEAAEELGAQADPVALATLARAARNDPSERVRHEAAESLGEVDLREAIDTLIVVARSLPDRGTRQEAVEALGERHEPAALEALVAIAREDPDRRVQTEATETIGDLVPRFPAALERLAELARSHPVATVRQEAIESFAEQASAPAAASLLGELLRAEPSEPVRGELLESLMELDGGAGVSVVLEVARSHPDPKLRRHALEALAESDDPRARRLFEELLTKP